VKEKDWNDDMKNCPFLKNIGNILIPPEFSRCKPCNRYFLTDYSLQEHLKKFHKKKQRAPKKIIQITDKQIASETSRHRPNNL